MKISLALLLLSLFIDSPKLVSQNSAAYQFDTLIYKHTLDLKPGTSYIFPKGSHLYEMTRYINKGGISVKFANSEGEMYHIAMDVSFYITGYRDINGVSHPVRYGDQMWKRFGTDAVREAHSIKSVEGAHVLIEFFTLSKIP